MGALVAFAAATTGLVRFDEWKARRRVEHKLILANLRFVTSIHGNGYGLGLAVANTADFPIEFEIVDLRTSLAERVPPQYTDTRRRSVVVPATGGGWWDDQMIKLDPPKPGSITGFIEYRLRYGRPEHLDYEMSGRKHVHVRFDDAAKPTHVAWNDVAG